MDLCSRQAGCFPLCDAALVSRGEGCGFDGLERDRFVG